MARGIGARRSNELYGGLLGDYLRQAGGLLAERAGEVISGQALEEYIQSLFPGFGTYEIVDGKITFPEARAPEGSVTGLFGEFMPGGGVAGTIAGVGAKTADRGLLAIAEEAEQRGLPQERIFDATGWFRGADGKWRFEIDDSAAKLTEWDVGKHGQSNIAWPNRQGPPTAMSHPDFMDHIDLERAYWPTTDMSPNVFYDELPGQWGNYYPPDDNITMDVSTLSLDDSGLSTGLHETMHSIQHREGFARGGTPSMFDNPNARPLNQRYLDWQTLQSDPRYIRLQSLRHSAERDKEISINNKIWREQYKPRLKEIEEKYKAKRADQSEEEYIRSVQEEMRKETDQLFDDFKKNVPSPIEDEIASLYDELGRPPLEKPDNQYVSAHEAYRRLAGEVEARNVQKRMGLLADDRRMLPPWMTEDVPRDQQIIRFE